jgi:hypothetical protein
MESEPEKAGNSDVEDHHYRFGDVAKNHAADFEMRFLGQCAQQAEKQGGDC